MLSKRPSTFAAKAMELQPLQPLEGTQVVNFTGAAILQNESLHTLPEVALRPLEGPTECSTDSFTDEENSRMQMLFNGTMCEEMKIPEGYQNVACLIIKWTKTLDQLDSGNEITTEVKHLHELLSQKFNYHTEITEINVETNPQLQMNQAVLNFVCKYNGPDNLLIVYYTGHSSYNEATTDLLLHASDTDANTTGSNYRPQVDWKRAERPLSEEAEGDVLVIFDSCFASNLYKGRQQKVNRAYELLCASGHDKLTAGPGPKSFTTALIWSLKELLEECKDTPFPTKQLCDKINLHPMRRGCQGHIWPYNRRYDRTIALTPLKNTLDERKREFSLVKTRATLSLRLSLTVDDLSDDEIRTMARALCKGVKKMEVSVVKRIDWSRLQSSRGTNSFANVGRAVASLYKYGKKWSSVRIQSPTATRNQTVQTTDEQHSPSLNGSPDSNMVEFPLEHMATPQTSRKRKYSD